jgi:hypothetical protein
LPYLFASFHPFQSLNTEAMKSILSLIFYFFFTSYSFATASGHFTLGASRFFSSQNAPVRTDEERIEGEYENRWKLSSHISFKFHPFLRATSHPQAYQEGDLFDPREVNLEVSFHSTFVRLGFLTLHWDGTDGLNPMDIASQKDWGDPMDPQTKASFGLQLARGTEHFDWEATYIPIQTPSTLPGDESAWWPRRVELPLRTDTVELRLPDHVDYHLNSRQELNQALHNNAALKVQYRSSYGDVAVGYFEGAAESPVIKPVINAVPVSVSPRQVYLLQSPIVITPVDYRRRTVSGLLSFPLGKWIFRVSSRYDQPLGTDLDLPTWSQQTVAGFERSVDLADQTVTFILQWAWAHHPEDASILSISDLFDKAVLWGMRAPLGESWTALVSGYFSTHDHSSYTQASLTRKLSDEWKAEALVQVLDGPSDSLLGVFHQNNRAALKITRLF